jgi:inosose dehydratase
LKDCQPEVAQAARLQRIDYFAAVRSGVFCELGRGAVDFRRFVEALRRRHYRGWGVVEQDVLPALGTPLASATRNRSYLRTLGL